MTAFSPEKTLFEANEAGPTAQTNFRRIEEKLRLPEVEALALFDTLSSRMSPDEFIPGQHSSSITTLYCDGTGLPFYRTSKAGGVRNRVRVRLYSAWDDPTEPYAWLEWKSSPARGTPSDDSFTTKRRFRVPRKILPTFFSSPPSLSELRSFQKSKNADDAEDCYQSLLQLIDGHQVRPLVASHYQRRALSFGDGSERITFDFHLGYSRIRWDSDTLVLFETIKDDAAIVECKRLSPLADWVQDLLQKHPRAVGFSKFEKALEVHWENHADRL
jgi:SPX domain protein involved in polyphosphate accumulation